ncbi:MAG TPA: hypothetical protein DCQ92_01145 [Verrucomicrobia subdivision 3 bacterium]|nr:hypothetical protein [Limisphaerales bacterium]
MLIDGFIFHMELFLWLSTSSQQTVIHEHIHFIRRGGWHSITDGFEFFYSPFQLGDLFVGEVLAAIECCRIPVA